MPKVFIVGGDPLIFRMFTKNGWGVVNHAEEADLIQFTGGADVSPTLYGEERGENTFINPERDAREVDIFKAYVNKKPMAGICRGAQFLNVMCGGKLRQHVTNHTRYHTAYDLLHGDQIVVSSTHHQMMVPGKWGTVIMVAEEDSKEWCYETKKKRPIPQEVESVLYKESKVLCYQPHPEYFDKEDDCSKKYFQYLESIM